MHTVFADPGFFGQIFQNAVAVTAICFIALAAAATLLAGAYIIWECVRLMRQPVHH